MLMNILMNVVFFSRAGVKNPLETMVAKYEKGPLSGPMAHAL